MTRDDLTAKRAWEVFHYCPSTGRLWRKGARASRIMRTMKNGYVFVGIDHHVYTAHRLAWLMSYGRWPESGLDHINGDRADNRLSNLRAVSQAVNAQNQRRAHTDNASGFLGVTRVKDSAVRPYVAQITHNGKVRRIGAFETPELAYAAYLEAKRLTHSGGTL